MRKNGIARLATFAAALLPLSAMAQQTSKLEYACTAEDIHELGLTCSGEEPCAVFVELTAVAQAGPRLVVIGNFHTGAQTLHAFVLMSDDGGRTFTEPQKRMRSTALEQIQFVDLESGWISGHSLLPLPGDAFVLVTSDGGKTFRKRALSEDTRSGAAEQFWFDTKQHGRFVVRHSAKFELWESMTGGESWSLSEVKSAPIPLPRDTSSGFRLRADKTDFRIERGAGTSWELVASFPLKAGDCKPPVAAQEPR